MQGFTDLDFSMEISKDEILKFLKREAVIINITDI